MSTTVTLPRDTNQARGLAEYALAFMADGDPSEAVRERTRRFYVDACLCGLSALALKTSAPTILRREALTYPDPNGATAFGSNERLKAEKAILANAAAVREWDSNGTNFGYNPRLGHTAGEFGHNDYYAVPIAAAQLAGLDGRKALLGMVLVDEIRGRLAEVFSLKSYRIDHVVHGAIASAATFGAMLGASAAQIESAIGMFVAHYIPWRAIRAGKQLSDSKGASAAISTEVAILSMKRAMDGFAGPQDIFRNPEALFRQFEPTGGDSPFDLALSRSGDDFAVMEMHFKLGLYEHQSAGALQGVIDLLCAHPELRTPGRIRKIVIRAYEPAYGIIGDPAKRDPKTRQSADHSMVFIVSRLLKKAMEDLGGETSDDLWKRLMLLPEDYGDRALFDEDTRRIMSLIEFEHCPDYDALYPEGIPTSVAIVDTDGRTCDSGLVMFPAGHARNATADLDGILAAKLQALGRIASPTPENLVERFAAIEKRSAADLLTLHEMV